MQDQVVQEQCVDLDTKSSTRDENSSSSLKSESDITECEASSSSEDVSSKERVDMLKTSIVLNDSAAGKGKEDVVIDVRNDSQTQRVGDEDRSPERVCRICYLKSDDKSGTTVLIKLGCACKGELGTCHRRCAETWFKRRGNRVCEICGKTANNIKGMQNIINMATVEARGSSRHWDERRIMASTYSRHADDGVCDCRQSFWNFVVICLVLGFILPWFFRVNML